MQVDSVRRVLHVAEGLAALEVLANVGGGEEVRLASVGLGAIFGLLKRELDVALNDFVMREPA